jgi:ABC-type nickel/cobalt efflux system permease component RcnA
LILMLFTFAVGSFSDTVHAATHNHTSGHHHLEHNVDADQEPCHSDQEQSHDENGCDDCCCAHSHSMVMSVISTKTLYATKQQNIIASLDDHYSVKLASLKRPPRL